LLISSRTKTNKYVDIPVIVATHGVTSKITTVRIINAQNYFKNELVKKKKDEKKKTKDLFLFFFSLKFQNILQTL
jgi:hypothetical protein